MENKEVLNILTECGSLLDGHFLLSSGKHSDRYCQCAKLLQNPVLAAKVLAPVAEKAKEFKADIIVGPAIGGIIVAYELARLMGIDAVFTERVDREMVFRRGFALNPSQRVIVAEDVITTGKSTMETVKAIEAFGAKVVGACCVLDRRTPDVDFPYPLIAATSLEVNLYDAENCPLCAKGLAFDKPGSRVFDK